MDLSSRLAGGETSASPDRAATGDVPPSTRLAAGAEGGFVATLVMTAYRLPVSRSLPPTATLWSRFVAGGRPEDHPVPAVALHLLYGTVAGAVFGLLAPLRGREPSTEPGESVAEASDETARLEAVGLLVGVGYALALSAFGERALLDRLLDVELDADESLVFHAGHVVYGLSLGTWVGSRTGDRR